MAVWTDPCVVETDIATIRGIVCLVRNIITPLPAIIILAALFMLLFAGFRWINAGSDPKALASAQQTFVWAILGVIMLSAAWLILVAIERFTGAPVTQFGIPE